MTIRFFYNGLKDSDGKLKRAFYHMDAKSGVITVYARDYTGFGREVREAFNVHNDTDIMTDYFDKDSFRVYPDHPLYEDVKAGFNALMARRERMGKKR